MEPPWGRLIRVWGSAKVFGLSHGCLYELVLLNRCPWGYDPFEPQIYVVKKLGRTVYIMSDFHSYELHWYYGNGEPVIGY